MITDHTYRSTFQRSDPQQQYLVPIIEKCDGVPRLLECVGQVQANEGVATAFRIDNQRLLSMDSELLSASSRVGAALGGPTPLSPTSLTVTDLASPIQLALRQRGAVERHDDLRSIASEVRVQSECQ